MYTVQLIDIVMASLMAVLLILFFTSLVWSMASVKIKALNEQHDRLYDAMNEEHDAMYESMHTYKAYMDAMHDAAIISFTYDPTKTPLQQLIDVVNAVKQEVLDPCISTEAQKLIIKAKREHGKKIRKAADRKLERTEREYEARITSLNIAAKTQQRSREHFAHENQTLRSDIGVIRAELSAFQSIVGQGLENFVRLPSVRNACIKAINQQHKAWQEL